MAIGIDDLDFDEDEDVIDNPQPDEDSGEEKPYEEDNNPPTYQHVDDEELEDVDEDILTTFLKRQGIKDLSKIKFEGDNGEIEETDWNSLNKEQQLNILLTSSLNPDTDLDDEEIDLINIIRENNLTPKEYIKAVQEAAIKNAPVTEEEVVYTVDELSDDDLFLLDLQTRIEDLTEDEAAEALEKAKSNELLYNKQIKGIREEYKKLEDDKNQREATERQTMQEERFIQFSNSIVNSINGFEQLGGFDIDMDKSDREELAEFILTNDEAGINWFSKALNNPDTLVKMAWFALNGEEAFQNINDYFANEITKAREAGYKLGLEDSKSGSPKRQSKMVIQKNNKNNRSKAISIDDLD